MGPRTTAAFWDPGRKLQDRFLELVKETNWDLFCHHAVDVANYKSSDFNVATAVENNTHRLPLVLGLLKDAGCSKPRITGSVFENDEGVGSGTLEAFSPYGLSKGLTWQMFRYYSQVQRLSVERRFTNYLIQSWFAGVTPTVNTPSYVRDNIHVSLLAKTYVRFATTLSNGVSRINPSGYIESQGLFAHRAAREMKDRLGFKCELVLKAQNAFSEPHIRINTDAVDVRILNWQEKNAWDEFADYYIRLNGKPSNQ